MVVKNKYFSKKKVEIMKEKKVERKARSSDKQEG